MVRCPHCAHEGTEAGLACSGSQSGAGGWGLTGRPGARPALCCPQLHSSHEMGTHPGHCGGHQGTACGPWQVQPLAASCSPTANNCFCIYNWLKKTQRNTCDMKWKFHDLQAQCPSPRLCRRTDRLMDGPHAPVYGRTEPRGPQSLTILTFPGEAADLMQEPMPSEGRERCPREAL